MRNRFRRLVGRQPVDVASQPDIEVEATRPCPYCTQPISRGATVCIHCVRAVVPLMSYADFARRFGSPHSGGPPHTHQADDPEAEAPT